MALIKNAIARDIARDAVVLDLGDLRRQGEAILRQARAEAERIIAAAREERARITAGAHESGRAEGLAQGLTEGRAAGREEALAQALAEHRARLEQVSTAWTAALEDFATQRDDLVQGAQRDVIRLAIGIAERIIKRSIELDPTVVESQLAAALAVVVRPTEVVIRIHPEDRPLVEQSLPRLTAAMPAIRHATIEDHPAVGRAGCEVWTRGDTAAAGAADAGGGEIDASIGTQMDRIVEALLPQAQKEVPTP